MYENYMQNLLGENYYPYQDTYEQMARNSANYNQMNEYGQCNCNMDYELIMPYMNNANYACNQTPYNYMPNYSSRNSTMKMEELYPEIYKLIYPMVKKACTQMNRSLDEELLENMTDEIYNNIEADNIISLNVNIGNQTAENNRTESNTSPTNNNRTNTHNVQHNGNEKLEAREDRQSRNNPIRDLIKILLIRELIDRPGNRPPRPYPPRPPMPPRPPRPGFPGNPPPSRPR